MLKTFAPRSPQHIRRGHRMRRPVGPSDSSRQTRMTVEELECRTQPAVLNFTVSIHVLDTPASTHTSAHVALPAQANAHAQTEIVIHFGGSSTLPGDSGGNGSGAGSGGGGNTSG